MKKAFAPTQAHVLLLNFRNYKRLPSFLSKTISQGTNCEKFYERSGKNFFGFVKHSDEVINKLKLRGFHATYDFSTLFTTSPHNFIKEKILD